MKGDEHVDWFLAELVRRANDGGLSVAVTLWVSGAVVSGFLIGGRDYFEGFADDVAPASMDSEAADRVRAFFRSPAAMYRLDERGVREVEADPEPLAYVHLRDARFFAAAGDRIPSSGAAFWRGRLSAVDGFVLGLLDPSDAGGPARGR